VTAYQPATGRPAHAGNAASTSPALDAVPVLVKRLDPGLPPPVRAHPGDAGVDLCAAAEVTLGPGERAVVPTGVAIALPDGYAAFVHPRSGLAARHGVTIVRFGRGDRIAQLVIQRVAVPVFHEVESLPGSARGDGGFGSTGGHAAAPGEGAPGPEAGHPRGEDEIVARQ